MLQRWIQVNWQNIFHCTIFRFILRWAAFGVFGRVRHKELWWWVWKFCNFASLSDFTIDFRYFEQSSLHWRMLPFFNLITIIVSTQRSLENHLGWFLMTWQKFFTQKTLKSLWSRKQVQLRIKNYYMESSSYLFQFSAKTIIIIVRLIKRFVFSFFYTSSLLFDFSVFNDLSAQLKKLGTERLTIRAFVLFYCFYFSVDRLIALELNAFSFSFFWLMRISFTSTRECLYVFKFPIE